MELVLIYFVLTEASFTVISVHRVSNHEFFIVSHQILATGDLNSISIYFTIQAMRILPNYAISRPKTLFTKLL